MCAARGGVRAATCGEFFVRALILADTSAWIEYDRATGSTADLRVEELIRSDGDIAVTEPVMMELFAGARDEAGEGRLRRLLTRFALLRFDAVVDLEGASLIYRRCRAAGVTPRGPIDCMVAAVAWRENATLLAHDADVARIPAVVGVPLDDASLRPWAVGRPPPIGRPDASGRAQAASSSVPGEILYASPAQPPTTSIRRP